MRENLLSPRERELLDVFGYVVLTRERLAELGLDCAALMSEVRDVVGRVHPEAPAAAKLMVPMMAGSTPVSAAWALDGVLPAIAAELLGETPLVKPAKLTRFPAATMWHRDTYLPIQGYKMGLYVEDEPVTFDLVAGSHRGAVQGLLDRDFGARVKNPDPADRNPGRVLRADVPATPLQLPPGGLLIFDLGLWHANLSAQGRLQWSVSYLRPGGDDEQLGHLAAYLGEFAEYGGSYPRDTYPYFPPSWTDASSGSPLYREAEPVLARMSPAGGLL